MKVIFLDRDDTLNHDPKPGYINNPNNFKLKDHVIEALILLQQAGFSFIVITNQSGISRGLITEKQLKSVHSKLEQLLSKEGIELKKIYYCPDKDNTAHHRKPNPGMIEDACKDFNIDIYNSYIIGDRIKDVQTGIPFNIPGILLDDPFVEMHSDDIPLIDENKPKNLIHSCRNLLQAAHFILQYESEKQWKHKIFHKHYINEAYNAQIQDLKKLYLKIVFTNGCFDILHSGHYQYLRQAATLGDIFIIGLNSDSSVKRLKGESRPIFSETERAMHLAQLNFVDMVIIFDEETPLELLQEIQPNVHVKGGDYQKEKMPEYPYLQSIDCKIFILPYKEGYSTSNVVNKIRTL